MEIESGGPATLPRQQAMVGVSDSWVLSIFIYKTKHIELQKLHPTVF